MKTADSQEISRPASEAVPSRRQRLLEVALLLLAAALFARACTWPLELLQPDEGAPPTAEAGAGLEHPPPAWLLPLDDAYIFVRYAQQLARGRPFQWSPDEASTGASSFAFPLLLLPGQWFSDGIEGWSRWSRFIGWLSLGLLALAAARLLRVAGLREPWPVAGGAALALSGPVGFAAVAGMESAVNGAALLWASALWIEAREGQAKRGRLVGLALLIALLPYLRPENAFVTGLAAVAVFLRLGPPLPRWAAPLLLVPGLAMAALNVVLTGEAQPAGAVSKGYLSEPFVPASAQVLRYGLDLVEKLAPVYLGAFPKFLWPPVGLLALAGAVAGLAAVSSKGASLASQRSLRRLVPVIVAWGMLCLLAPLSAQLHWQLMRHHHGALVLAWVLAFAALAAAVEHVRRRWLSSDRERLGRALQLLPVAVPLALLASLPFWGVEYARVALVLQERNGLVAPYLATARERLAASGEAPELLLNDAGLLALAWDGPMVDAMGLGTGELTRPYLNGPGALVESLARRQNLPRLAAVNPDLVPLPELLGPPLFPDYQAVAGTELRALRTDLLAAARLPGRGIDLAHLPDEAGLRWELTPDPNRPSYALLRPTASGAVELQGCRVLYGKLGVPLPEGGGSWRLRAVALGQEGATVRLFAGDSRGPAVELAAAEVPPDLWQEVDVVVEEAATHLWIENAGRGLACLESLSMPISIDTATGSRASDG